MSWTSSGWGLSECKPISGSGMLRRKPWPALARPRWTLWALVRHFAFAWMGSFGPRPSSDHSPNLPFGHCTSTAGQRSRGPAQGLEVSGPEAAKRSGGRAVACEAAAPQKSRQGLISAFGQIPGLLDSGSRALLVPLPPPWSPAVLAPSPSPFCCGSPAVSASSSAHNP